MFVPLLYQIGLDGETTRLPSAIELDSPSVGDTSRWAGSYHVLEMADHYDDYVISNRIPSLRRVPGFDIAHAYCRLTNRLRDPGVTGNIGEAIAALFAVRCLGASPRDIAHLRPRKAYRGTKSPDYIMRIGSSLSAKLPTHFPSRTFPSLPGDWPVESKARNNAVAAKQAREAAFRQLCFYWSKCRSSSVGFGAIVCLTYETPRELRANFFVPKDLPGLISALEHLEDVDPKPFLHGCSI